MNALAALAIAIGVVAVHVPFAPATAAEARQIPLRDFFRNPEQTGHQLSPDGRWIAYLAPWQSRLNIHVRPTAGGEPKRVTAETARDIRRFFWKGNDRLLYTKDFGGDENDHVVSVDREGNGLKDLTPYEGVRAEIVDELPDLDESILVSHNRRDARVFDVYRVDVATGASTLVAENPGNVTGWLADHAGRLRLATASDGVNSTLLYRETEADAFRPILTTNFREQAEPAFFTPDNRRLYAVSNIGRDKAAAVVLDPATGREVEVLYQNPDVDVGRLAYSRARKTLTAASYTTWRIERRFFDPEVERHFRALQSMLPGYEIGIASANKAEDLWIVSAAGDRTRGARYLYDTKTRRLTKLAEVSPWLPEGELAEMKPVAYTARDGLTIHGYLTLPKGREAAGLPVVVNVHGGPWARDTWRFNPEVQFLANRGYAVLQPNFRGSTGYGRGFVEASFKQWGRAMQDDVSDGVKWLVAQGIADPKRVCIYGGSYGGYATLAGLAFTPELYACGIDYVGVSNLFTFFESIPPYWKPFAEMMYEMVGHPERDKALLEAASPVFHADRIRAPLLIAQGARDPRVKKAESDQMVEAMRKRGVEVEYLVKDNEGHGFHNEENRFELYGAMERFLARHLAPGT